jgi:hypothetical protein
MTELNAQRHNFRLVKLYPGCPCANRTCKATKKYLSDFSCWSNFLDSRFNSDQQLRSAVTAANVRLVALGAVVALAEEAETTKCSMVALWGRKLRRGRNDTSGSENEALALMRT